MSKRVLAVGNCSADHAAVRAMIEQHFDARVVRAHRGDDALAELRQGSIDLVLVNRKLDRDLKDGLEVIKQIKADPQFAATPCMLITNFPEHQQRAVQAGALDGFGKADLHGPGTIEKLRAVLG